MGQLNVNFFQADKGVARSETLILCVPVLERVMNRLYLNSAHVLYGLFGGFGLIAYIHHFMRF